MTRRPFTIHAPDAITNGFFAVLLTQGTAWTLAVGIGMTDHPVVNALLALVS